jgi:hypothetical protein
LVARFRCNSAGFFASSTLSLTGLELPRKRPNLSPKPSPTSACAVVDGDNSRESLPVARVGRLPGWWRIGELRLALRADGFHEARHTRFAECAEELVEWPGRVAVGGLLCERCPRRPRG